MPYPRSHTDPIANLVVLSDVDIRRHLGEILDRDLPIGTMPTFLHEATHHWCFDTPVGAALHLLFLRARRSALQGAIGSKSGSDRSAVFHNVVRYEVALEMLRPLSEGVALFAEHDAMPGDTETISTPLMQVGGLYGRGLAVSGDKPWDGLPLVLAAGRVSRAHVRRKADLLLQPLGFADGGYLAGYLLVKSLWHVAVVASDMFIDTDFFLQFMRGHFFDDWGLAAVLLDDSVPPEAALQRISDRLNKQLREFVATAIHGDRPKRFEAMCVRDDRRSFEIRTPVLETGFYYRPPLSVDSPVEEQGRQLLRENMTAFFDMWPNESVQRAFMLQDIRELAIRSTINLGHAELEGRRTDEGFAICDGAQLIATLPSASLAEDRQTAGPLHVDIMMPPGPAGLCLVLTRENQVLCCHPIGNFKVPPELIEMVVNREARINVAEMSQSLIQQVLRDSDYSDHLVLLRKQIKDGLGQGIFPAALVGVSIDRVSHTAATMREDGLLPLLDGDIGLLLDLAAASLCLPTKFGIAAMESFHTWSAGSVLASVNRINALLGDRLGFQPFLVHDGHVVRFSRL